MTRRDFILIARVVAQIEPYPLRRAVAVEFVKELKLTNPAFNQKTFLNACNALAPESTEVWM